MQIKRKDCMLILFVLCAAGCIFLVQRCLSERGAGSVVVHVDGEITGIYDLAEDGEIPVNDGTNLLEIKDGEVSMTRADCPDQICVHPRAISADGESIICLPNRVVVEITAGKENPLDAVTN